MDDVHCIGSTNQQGVVFEISQRAKLIESRRLHDRWNSCYRASSGVASTYRGGKSKYDERTLLGPRGSACHCGGYALHRKTKCSNIRRHIGERGCRRAVSLYGRSHGSVYGKEIFQCGRLTICSGSASLYCDTSAAYRQSHSGTRSRVICPSAREYESSAVVVYSREYVEYL